MFRAMFGSPLREPIGQDGALQFMQSEIGEAGDAVLGRWVAFSARGMDPEAGPSWGTATSKSTKPRTSPTESEQQEIYRILEFCG